MITDFSLSHYIELNITRTKNQGLLGQQNDISWLLANERETLKLLKWISKATMFKLAYFLFYYTLPATLDTNAMARKISCIFFPIRKFINKTSLNFHSFNKVNDFVTTQYATTIFCPFYLNPQS